MARFYQPPQAIEMSIGLQDAPLGFVWGDTYHPVRYIVRAWEEDRGWWIFRKWRAYYRIVTGTGLAVELYQECASEAWFIHRCYG